MFSIGDSVWIGCALFVGIFVIGVWFVDKLGFYSHVSGVYGQVFPPINHLKQSVGLGLYTFYPGLINKTTGLNKEK